MSLSLPAERVRASDAAGLLVGPLRRSRRSRAWSLRARLLVGQVVLLAVVCLVIGTATEIALQQFLVHQLDERVIHVGHRSAEVLEFGRPPRRPGDPEASPTVSGPGPAFLGGPGQPSGTVAAVVTPGLGVEAGVLTLSGSRAELTDRARAQLAGIPADEHPVTVDLDGVGRYRLIATHTGAGATIVTGLSLADADATLLRFLLVFTAVAVVALTAAAMAGILVIRRALHPLTGLSQAARNIADLELDRGEVQLPVQIAEGDADSRTEVGQLGAALNRMLEHIAAAMSARHASETRVRQFVADASHELRTPLAAIRGYTELAQRKRDEMPSDVADAMQRVESETARMTALVEDMLLLARLDVGRPLERESVDLSRLTVDAVSDAHIAGPDHRWLLDLPEEPVLVVGDTARLHQALANLLANARTHTPPGTTVTTSLVADSIGGAVLSVVDDGPGIPPGLEPEIFERFARGDSSRSRRGGGTGLGLAIVAAVVKAHRGTITVHSVPHRTEFTIWLPPHTADT